MKKIPKDKNTISTLKPRGKVPANIRGEFISSILNNQPEIKHFKTYKTDLGDFFLTLECI